MDFDKKKIVSALILKNEGNGNYKLFFVTFQLSYGP